MRILFVRTSRSIPPPEVSGDDLYGLLFAPTYCTTGVVRLFGASTKIKVTKDKLSANLTPACVARLRAASNFKSLRQPT